MAVPPPSPLSADPAKPAVRARLRAARRGFVAGLRQDDRLAAALGTAAERVAAHVPAGASVALYSAFGDEIDPAPLAALLAARGHRLALPHVGADGTTLRFLHWSPDAALIGGRYGLMQPDEKSEEIAPTMILTPLVGFDRLGGRIGQGAGFYDRAFAALPGAVRIGFAWSVQELDCVPLDPWDVPLHGVATEAEWIVIGDARA